MNRLENKSFINDLLASIAMVLPLVLLSPLFNLVLFHDIMDQVTFYTHSESWRFFPGMLVVTLAWGVILLISYKMVHGSIQGSGLRKGFNFGVFVWFICILFAEFFNYTLIQLPFLAVVSGLLHNLISLPIGGMLMVYVLSKKQPQYSS